MIIIIEGTEGSGKTTLAKRLAAQTGYEYMHRSKPKNDEERRNMLDGYYTAIYANDNVIFDRCWYSEMVYGKIMRDNTAAISMVEMHELECAIASTGGGLIVHCTDEVDLLWQRSQERGEEYITEYETLAKLKFEYEYLFHDILHYLPIVRYELSNIRVK